MEDEISGNVVPALLATLISGLSTGVGSPSPTLCHSPLTPFIGGVMILFYGKPSNTKIGHMLSFSSGVMLCILPHFHILINLHTLMKSDISFMDLLYESILKLGFFTANLWVCISTLHHHHHTTTTTPPPPLHHHTTTTTSSPPHHHHHIIITTSPPPHHHYALTTLHRHHHHHHHHHDTTISRGSSIFSLSSFLCS